MSVAKSCRFCAKRMLKWYPKLLNDIYLSEVNSSPEKLIHQHCVLVMSTTGRMCCTCFTFTLSHYHIFLVRSTTGRMCCTWDVWPRMPPLLNGFLTLAPISTGSNSQMHAWIKTNKKTEHKNIIFHLQKLSLMVDMKGDVMGTSSAATTRNGSEETQKPTNLSTSLSKPTI